jgi:subtilisin family serine protease
MRILTSFLLAALTVTPSVALSAVVDPQLRWITAEKESDTSSYGVSRAPSTAGGLEKPIRVLVTGDEVSVGQRISQFGGKVLGYHAGAIHAEVTATQLRLLAAEPAVAGLHPSRKLKPSLNVSRPAIGADKVNLGEGLDQPYTGRGVIVGVVDTGIDISHPDFMNDDGSTRIINLWDQTLDFSNGQQRPAGFNYGVECTAEHINAYLNGEDPLDSCPSDDGRPIDGFPSEGHGTHVAGIAASSDATYTGIAPEASVIAVRAHFEEGSILDGVDYVLSKCEAYQRPCVINLSLGTTAGAHDGTALIEELLAEKTGPGRIIVAAAGNEANLPEANAFGHADIHLANTGGLKKGVIVFPNTSFIGNDDFSIVLDIWNSTSTNHAFYIAAAERTGDSLNVHNGFTGAYITPPLNGETSSHPLSDGWQVYGYVHITSLVSTANNRRETLLAIDRCADTPCALGGTIDSAVSSFSQRVFLLNVKDTGTDQLDMWPLNTSATFYGPTENPLDFPWAGAGSSHSFEGGDNESTITIPATAEEIIAVGSYITKTEWVSFSGVQQEFDDPIGGLSAFSSLGPATDGRIKPDLAAPGEWIASSHSTREPTLPSIWKPDEFHIHLLGTSMAAPHVAGVVALMLQKNGTLRPADLVGEDGLLTRNTQTTSGSGELPNISFGYGALDALQVFQDPALTAVPDSDQTGPTIRNVKVTTSGGKATIRWSTSEPSMSGVILQPIGGGTEKRASQKSYVRSHSITMSGLRGDEYRVTVLSTDLAGNTTTERGPDIALEACGCSSKSGPTPWDAIPLVGVALAWVFMRSRRA